MSNVTPPPPPPPTAPPTPAAAQPTAIVLDPPPSLLQLTAGTRIDAVIQGVVPEGRVEIETPFGRLVIQTAFPLPKDGPLQLQLLAKGLPPQFTIISIHGMAPLAALRALGLSSPGATSAGGTGGPAAGAGESAAVTLTLGATLAATLLRGGTAAATEAPPAGSQPGAQPGQVPGGGPTTGAAAGAQTPGGAAATLSGSAAGGAGSPGTPAQPATGATAHTATGAAAGPQGAGQTAAIPGALPGTRFSVRITAFQPAAPGAGAVQALKPGTGSVLVPGSTLTGVVTGKAVASGHPIIQTHAGALVIATRTPLPVGSAVTFEVLSQTAGTTETLERASVHLAGLSRGPAESWPGLEEALRSLKEINPAVAQQMVQAVLPRAGTTLAANLLFFLVALSGGNLRNWIGDAPARILQRLKPDLMTRLSDDFGRIARTAEEPASGSDWRNIPIPFHNGAEIEQIRLFMRPAGEEEEDEESSVKGTRFVIELNLTRLGRFQLDGLVREDDKRMDLIVRTEDRLPEKIQNDIRDIFQNANEVTGNKGGIVFQAAPPNFVVTSPSAPPEDHLGLIV